MIFNHCSIWGFFRNRWNTIIIMHKYFKENQIFLEHDVTNLLVRGRYFQWLTFTSTQQPSVSNSTHPQYLFIISVCLQSQKNYCPKNAKKKNAYKYILACYIYLLAMEYTLKDCSVQWPVSSICLSVTGFGENWDTSSHRLRIRQTLMKFLKLSTNSMMPELEN